MSHPPPHRPSSATNAHDSIAAGPLPTSSHLAAAARGPSKRTLMPSPLHAAETYPPGPIVDDDAVLPDPDALPFPRPPASPQPASPPHAVRASPPRQTPSPRERLDALLATEAVADTVSNPVRPSTTPITTPLEGTASGTTTPSAYGALRNVSAPGPLNLTRSVATSSPSAMSSANPLTRPDIRPALRTSSIDSAISSLSSQTSHSQRSTPDAAASPATDVTHLITTAGSPEAVIQHLLKEKQSSASQNAQLWRLVDKQRTMILGLNKDLEQALKDKERYRRKLKEHLAQPPPVPALDTGSIGGPPERSATRPPPPPPPSAPRDTSPVHDESIADSLFSGHGQSTTRADRDDQLVDPLTVPNLEPLPLSPRRRGSAPAHPVVPEGVDNHSSDQASTASEGTEVTEPETSPRTETVPKSAGPMKGSPPTLANGAQEPDANLPRGFGAQRALPRLGQLQMAPTLSLTEPSPVVERSTANFPRKAPPAPLNLAQRNPRASAHLHQMEREDHSDSDYDDILEVDEIPVFERGRRKTREEDDREREEAAQRESAHSSRSKKEKGAKPASEGPTSPRDAPARQTVPISPPDSEGSLRSPTSLATVLGAPRPQSLLVASPSRNVSGPVSPGLPTSPRPGDRPLNSPAPRLPREGTSLPVLASPPLSPRIHTPGLPMSPRPTTQSIARPPSTPASIRSPTFDPASGAPRAESTTPPREDPAPSVRSSPPRGIYRGFISEQHPHLLLGPPALRSIYVKVLSSRLRPSRASFITGKTKASEEEAVFTLGVVAHADDRELWQVERDVMSLPQLDHQLKKTTQLAPRLPDRSLFNGHAPAKVDARRAALEQYLEAILQMPMDEPTALIICRFLSADALEPELSSAPDATISTGAAPSDPGARPRKEGYLTKRGKNFGGWKARYFCLDGPILRYYESPGGPHLGTIKLPRAQIGKQSPQRSGGSPARGEVDDLDDQYRHAFMILEPKKKDSASHVRHVLCAESDAERDAWVAALLRYVDDHPSEDERASAARTVSIAEPPPAGPGRHPRARDLAALGPAGGDSPVDTLRGVSYEDTVQAEAPVRGPTPTTGESPSKHGSYLHGPPASAASQHPSMHISGPTNGVKIQDVGAWGNKLKPSVATEKEKREPKKRGLWGFKGRSSSDLNVLAQASAGSTASLAAPGSTARHGAVRAVFGAPLVEAVEYSHPIGIDVYLPAVVYRCIEYLDAKNAASEEGIFRLSGSNVLIKTLRERFNTEGDVNLMDSEQYYDIHAVASLLKLYLRELPATVLTRELHLDFLHVLEIDNKPGKVSALRGLVHRLPRANHSLLRALSAFLITIVNNSDSNKMTVRNVGIVFSPTLNIPAPVLSMFLNEFDDIFGADTEDYSPTSPTTNTTTTTTTTTEVSISAADAAPDEIRSPRRQMFQDLPTPAYHQSTFTPAARAFQPAPAPSHLSYETGFTPMQPSYDPPSYAPNPFATGLAPAITMPGPEYGSLNGALAPNDARDGKARRRESSMLLMGMGQRQSSMPQLRESTSMRA
ncbi:MAG: hypothetical protein M1838_005654 [Thelocarpon superellum]|nr:MAG: hypothetical protein M1838_005654 [Thelocarpon superellum]